MALQSQLFRGDARLEAAASSDPAHVAQGATGDHVRKIQRALNELDGATLAVDGVYGPATAAAVLAYKRKRNIVNRTRQAQADNIVGIMTMAALDAEMLAAENQPVLIESVFPSPGIPAVTARSGLILGFGLGGGVFPQLGPAPILAPASSQPTVDVILAPGGVGFLQVDGGKGGKLIREQFPSPDSENPFQVAGVEKARSTDRRREEFDIVDDPQKIKYSALNCGETFMQVRDFPSPTKRSAVVHLLVLVASAGPSAEPEGAPASGLPSGLVSVDGTPINALPGRKINLFGEEESHGFEDYASDLNHCTATRSRGGPKTGLIHRPWTNDPRKPPGIGDQTVSNICARGSPMKPVTIGEILRIGKSGCRVTYADAGGRVNVDKLRAGLKGAKIIDEGEHTKGGRAIVFELA